MIKFATINCEGVMIERTFESIAHILKDWWDEEGTTLPAGDDPVIFYNIDGNEIHPKDFKFDTFINELETQYWYDYEI